MFNIDTLFFPNIFDLWLVESLYVEPIDMEGPLYSQYVGCLRFLKGKDHDSPL